MILVHGRVSVPGVNFLVLQSAFAAEKQAQADWLAAQRDANPGCTLAAAARAAASLARAVGEGWVVEVAAADGAIDWRRA